MWVWSSADWYRIQALGKCLTRAVGIVEIDACDSGDGQAWRIASGVVLAAVTSFWLDSWSSRRSS